MARFLSVGLVHGREVMDCSGDALALVLVGAANIDFAAEGLESEERPVDLKGLAEVAHDHQDLLGRSGSWVGVRMAHHGVLEERYVKI